MVGRVYVNEKFQVSPNAVMPAPKQIAPPVGIGTSFPYWLAVVVLAAIGGAPWIKPHFSLRTLLIATTLVAVILGAVVLAAR
jgi:glucose uptake protein GlcU